MADQTTRPARRRTIYGDYVAPAVASTLSQWHIQGNEPDVALCGKRLSGDLRRMDLHVAFLECSTCMALGESKFPSLSEPAEEENRD